MGDHAVCELVQPSPGIMVLMRGPPAREHHYREQQPGPEPVAVVFVEASRA